MRYQARVLDTAGLIGKRTIDAADEASARRVLASAGCEVLGLRRLPFQRRQRFQLPVFCDQLLTLLRAGIPVREALVTLAENEMRPESRQVIADVAAALAEGLPLSAALAREGGVFPALLVALVRASEKTGAIDDALERYAIYHRQVDELRSRLAAAVAYPALLVGIGGLVIAFLLFHVVPRFAQVYADVHGPLPLAARLLLMWGDWVHDHGWITFLALAGGLGASALVLIRQGTRLWLARQMRRLPRLGDVLQRLAYARLYRTLGLLLQAGLPVTTALGLVLDLAGSESRIPLAEAKAAVERGSRLSAAFAEHGLATAVALRLLRAGEISGQLGDMLGRVADFHDREIARTTELFTRLLGPLLMLAIGLVIGLIVVMLYLPIFQLAEGLG